MRRPTFRGSRIRMLCTVGIIVAVLGGTSIAGQLARDPHDAAMLENDVLGVRVWGPPTQPTLSLGKSDIWDRRWFGDRQPPVTMKKLRELAAQGRLAEVAPSPNLTVYNAYSKYDFPCPKPGAQVVLLSPFATSVQVEPDGFQAVRLTMVGQNKRLAARVWVAAARPLVVIECQGEGLKPGDLRVRVYRHRDTIVPGGLVSPTIGGAASAKDFEQLPIPRARDMGKIWGIAQDFPAEGTFPGGFRVVAASAVIGTVPAVECRQGEKGLGTPLWAPQEGRMEHGTVKRYAPINDAVGAAATASFRELPKSFVVLATVATTQDGSDPWQVATQTVNDAASLGIDGLRKEQSEVVRRCTRKHPALARWNGHEVFGVPSVVLPSLRKADGYYGDVPICGACGNTKFCFQDAGLWHDDFHLNEMRPEPWLVLGQFEATLAYSRLFHTMLPQMQENARDVYDLPGAMYPLAHFPLRCRGAAHTNLTWEQDMGLNGGICKPLWLHYRYTGDKAFLREVAYPVIKECARFMAAYVTEQSDGNLHIVPTVSPEHWGLTSRFERNRDSTSSLTMTRYLLRAAADAAKILGEDRDEAVRWRAASDRLAPYPTCKTPAGPVWVDVAGAPPIEYNTPVPVTPIMWGNDVGLDSPPEILALAKRTLDQIRVWPPHRGCLAFVRPRLGIYQPGTELVPENFLVSYQSIHIMPAVPADADIVMENFMAEGGFRISAKRPKNGQIQDLQIVSLLGEPCHLSNPWPGRRVEVRSTDGKGLMLLDATLPCLTFATEAERTYLLKAQ